MFILFISKNNTIPDNPDNSKNNTIPDNPDIIIIMSGINKKSGII